jgi:hypothetical protein
VQLFQLIKGSAKQIPFRLADLGKSFGFAYLIKGYAKQIPFKLGPSFFKAWTFSLKLGKSRSKLMQSSYRALLTIHSIPFQSSSAALINCEQQLINSSALQSCPFKVSSFSAAHKGYAKQIPFLSI